MSESTARLAGEPKALAERSGIALALGLLLIAAGIISVTAPLATTVSYEPFLGGLLIIGGLLQALEAYRRRKAGDLWIALGPAAAALVAGAILMGVETIAVTLIVGVFFIVDAALRLLLAARPSSKERRRWVAAGGLLSLVFGLIALLGMEDAAGYAIAASWGVHALYVGGLLTAAATRPGEQAEAKA